ncbi:hypothetical protein [Streptomyces nanshensis]|uniref:Uncharacterized protein n=1 Tax=Streptomyces nanshensis TaxID=518642 RepID=A0A1E7L0Y4_9ACTN|nr:hypothetical protein [Streptomyces nanshensis]OEV09791.1 hypothetical protein AN218_20510 [Streptomyces nanshensis]
MPEEKSRPEKLWEAALKATGGREPTGLFRVDRPVMGMGNSRDTPWRQRPWVLTGPEVAWAPLRKILVVALRIVSFDVPDRKIQFSNENIGASERAKLVRKSNKPQDVAIEESSRYYGPADSTAAQLLVASLPRSKTRVMSLLCVTSDELLLLHVPDTYRKKRFANAVDIGWRCDRRLLEWTRNISAKRPLPKIQYGFTDGSWMTLHTAPVEGRPAFTDVFPHTLTKQDPIPPNANYPEPEPSK